MKIYDISWPISPDMTAYKDRHVVKFEQTKVFEQDNVRESVVTLGSHSGTHIDAPAHFLEDGSMIDSYQLSQLVGAAQVLDLSGIDELITKDDLEKHDIKKDKIILLKTDNSSLPSTARFTKEFVYLAQLGAEYLADIGVKAVGIDYLGIERAQRGHETHEALLKKNIPIIEGLRLGAIDAGNYQCVCLPLSIVGLEAAPARVVLLDEK